MEEFAGIVGRRGGKSRAISVIATYVAGLCEHPALVSGERGVVLIACPDQRQATICLDYIEANFRNSPILRQLIETRTARTLRLSNGIDVEVRASDFRTLRGPSFVLVILNEVAFLMFDEGSGNPDTEIINAIDKDCPTGGALFMISSPYARRGAVWGTFQLTSAQMAIRWFWWRGVLPHFQSPLPQRVLIVPTNVMQRGPVPNMARSFAPTSNFSSASNRPLPAWPRVASNVRRADLSYHGFADPSGGSQDSFTLCIGHMISPDSASWSIAQGNQTAIKSRGRGERIQPSAEELQHRLNHRRQICWHLASRAVFALWRFLQQSAAPKSDLYRDLLPLINSGRIDLFDNVNCWSADIAGTSRGPGGRDSIDHPPGAHAILVMRSQGWLKSTVIWRPYPSFSSVDGRTEMTPAAARARAREERAQWDVQQMLGHIRRCGIPVW